MNILKKELYNSFFKDSPLFDANAILSHYHTAFMDAIFYNNEQ